MVFVAETLMSGLLQREHVPRSGGGGGGSVVSDPCDSVDCSPPGSSVHGISQALLCWRHCLIMGSGSHTWEPITAEEASERTVTSPLPRCSS